MYQRLKKNLLLFLSFDEITSVLKDFFNFWRTSVIFGATDTVFWTSSDVCSFSF